MTFKRKNWLLRNASSQTLRWQALWKAIWDFWLGWESKEGSLKIFLYSSTNYQCELPSYKKVFTFFPSTGGRKTDICGMGFWFLFSPPKSYKTSMFYRSSYVPEMRLEFKNGSWMQPQSLGLWHLDTIYRSPSPEKRATASLWSSWTPEGLLCFHGKGHQTTTWALLYQIISWYPT